MTDFHSTPGCSSAHGRSGVQEDLSSVASHAETFRISPEMTIAIGATVMEPSDEMKGQMVEMVASRHPRPMKWKRTNAFWRRDCWRCQRGRSVAYCRSVLEDGHSHL